VSTPKSYVIKGRQEETDCAQCGRPLFNMDRAYFWGRDDSKSFCSHHCAARALDPPKLSEVVFDFSKLGKGKI